MDLLQILIARGLYYYYKSTLPNHGLFIFTQICSMDLSECLKMYYI